MTIAARFPGTAQGDGLQDRHIILNNRRLPHHNTGGMVEHNPAANFRCRVNIHLKRDRNLILQEDSQRAATFIPQPVTNAVGL